MPLENTLKDAAVGSAFGPTGTAVGASVGAVTDIASSAFNVHEARQNRRFQRDMANTAHQREVKDLVKAGLNPVLSARLGGASTPPTSAAQITSPMQGAKSGADIVAARQNADLLKAQTRNLNAQAGKAEVDARLAEAGEPFASKMPEADLALKRQSVYVGDVSTTPAALRALAEKIIAEASTARSSAALLSGQVPAAYNQSEMSKTWYGKHVLPYIRSILDASGVYKNVK